MANPSCEPAGFGIDKQIINNHHRIQKKAISAHLLFEEGKFVQAEIIYKSLIKDNFNHFLVLGNLAIISARKGKLIDAENFINHALAINPDFSEGWATLGFIQKAQAKFEQAIISYEKCLFLSPENVICYYNLGNVLTQLSRFNEAIAAYKQAIHLNPRFVEALTNLGFVFAELGEHHLSIASYLDALSINPNHLAALNNLGKAYQALGDITSAIEIYKRALVLNPSSPDLLFNLGIALTSNNNIQEATHAYHRALELKPDFAAAYLNLGLIHAKLNKYPEAISFYEKALQLNPKSVQALFNLAYAHTVEGNFENAIYAYKNVLLINPELVEAERYLSLFLDAKDDSEPLFRAQQALKTTSAPDQQANLYFAIAKYMDDLSDESAFDFYHMGNKIMHSLFSWQIPDINKLVEANRSIGSISSTWPDEYQPIFLVGIPCCGAELVQMVLAQNHSLGNLCKDHFFNHASNYILDSNINSFPESKISAIKELYHDHDMASLLADESLFGFQYCTAIAKIFPRAKIIHCFRNPISNLLAIYKGYWGSKNPWSYNIDDLITYFEFYQKIMAFHMAEIPASIINWNVDKMLSNPEIQIPRLIELCEFDWSNNFITPDIKAEFIKFQKNILTFNTSAATDDDSDAVQNQLFMLIVSKLANKGIACDVY